MKKLIEIPNCEHCRNSNMMSDYCNLHLKEINKNFPDWCTLPDLSELLELREINLSQKETIKNLLVRISEL